MDWYRCFCCHCCFAVVVGGFGGGGVGVGGVVIALSVVCCLLVVVVMQTPVHSELYAETCSRLPRASDAKTSRKNSSLYIYIHTYVSNLCACLFILIRLPNKMHIRVIS